MRATKLSKPRAASYAAVGLMIAFLVPASASAGHPSTGHDAMTLDIEDYVGTLRIIPNTEDKIEIISVEEGVGNLGTLSVSTDEDGGVSVRGAPASLAMNCPRTNGELSISFDNGEMHPIGDFPTVVISAPTSTNVRISMRAGDAEIADADNLEILAGGCSRIIANNVTDTFRLTTTGALALEMSGAEVAEIDASNGGHIRISEIRNRLHACLGRTSRLVSDQLTGTAEIYQSGTSRITLDSVTLTDITAELDGTATLQMAGTASDARMSLGGASQAKVSNGITLAHVDLQRAGRLLVDGVRWKGTGND